ncbi:MAG: PQQ-dependent sugar dehydrogenase [bacterium]|nr:PQQ-dependent sugar dehydrogenase [bacterium]
MWKVLGFILVLVIVAVGLVGLNSNSTPPKGSTQSKTSSSNIEISKVEVIAKNLEVPWALAFLPNGDILVTERKGLVRLIKDGQLLQEPVITLSKVKQSGESGLHGIAIHPDFPQKPYVYLYYTYSTGGDDSLNKVSRFIYEDKTLKDEAVIVDKIPGAVFHDGGRIKFDPDEALYITTGDALNSSLSQDRNSLAGKILRVRDEGNVEMYSYGHRNPQGIAWDGQGRLWETEHGQSATDEVNLIEEGKNYGWPTITGEQKQQDMQEPVLQSGSNTWAPAGVAFYKGSIYFGGLRGQALYQFNIDTLEFKEHFKKQFGRIRDVVLGPDNMLYITTSNRDGRGSPSPDDDKIMKINPEKLL